MSVRKYKELIKMLKRADGRRVDRGDNDDTFELGKVAD